MLKHKTFWSIKTETYFSFLKKSSTLSQMATLNSLTALLLDFVSDAAPLQIGSTILLIGGRNGLPEADPDVLQMNPDQKWIKNDTLKLTTVMEALPKAFLFNQN